MGEGVEVYPRVHGGTGVVMPISDLRLGLSPRARGNRVAITVRAAYAGSIPACTGEPPWVSCRLFVLQVYPRVHGGTTVSDFMDIVAGGLSPRARGNRRQRRQQGWLLRSIPACTGEPFPIAG